jgi:hypothetical protein
MGKARRSRSSWTFSDPENVAVITTKSILQGAGVLYVSHDEEDGAWQFLDGQSVSEADAAVVSLREIVEMDNSLMQLADLPLGWIAWRENKTQPWIREDRIRRE